jgi:hypothetical protein
MADDSMKPTPQSPELQPAGVRDQLHQTQVTHEGEAESVEGSSQSAHLGATDEQMTPITPPMHGPGNLVGPDAAGDSRDEPTDAPLIDPVDEITPG